MNLGGVIHLNKTGICIVCAICCILFLYILTNRESSAKQSLTGDVDLRKLLSVAIKASQIGGDEVVRAKDSIVIENKGKTKEGLNDTVTTADFKSHCAMKQTLKHFFPNVLVISEEAKAACTVQELDYTGLENVESLHETWIAAKDITIWIDPLDATKEYTEKLYKFVTTMVCVAVNGVPIIGVIYKPFTEEISWAWVGNEKSADLKTVQVKKDDLNLKFIVSRSHSGQVKETLEASFDKPTIITAAGAGYKVLELASGKADVYVHTTAIKKWDICAGNAILNALGGKMTTRKNNRINYLDAANVVNDEGLVATLENHDAIVGKL